MLALRRTLASCAVSRKTFTLAPCPFLPCEDIRTCGVSGFLAQCFRCVASNTHNRTVSVLVLRTHARTESMLALREHLRSSRTFVTACSYLRYDGAIAASSLMLSAVHTALVALVSACAADEPQGSFGHVITCLPPVQATGTRRTCTPVQLLELRAIQDSDQSALRSYNGCGLLLCSTVCCIQTHHRCRLQRAVVAACRMLLAR